MDGEKEGGCGCGRIRFTVTGKIRNVVNCHCSKCRRFNGAAFSSYAVVAATDLRFERGEDELSEFCFPAGATRHFCHTCGTPVFNTNPVYPGYRMVHVGTFDHPGELAPRMNIFCSTQLEWPERLTELPSFPGPFQR